MGEGRDGRATGVMQGTVVVVILALAIALGFAGHLSQAIAAGWSEPRVGNPIELLGTTLHTSCPSAPQARGNDLVVVCPDWTAITTVQGLVLVVSLYGPGNAVVDTYAGALPQGLASETSITDTWETLGRPSHITGVYGTPMLVYTFDGERYGSLELRFDGNDRLVRINASVTR